ncbi:MAG: hypothetical protein COU72_04895 [Parcubacteria group bacterium CG10_big_fil_rev_8_21_14_0_10_41_35]|nr:MAG: hypothetical protein COU72_04895 [Parcubacteria group bacterium CG10_big_fil_rev_8_21_14_0_10_41_35]
MKKTTIGMVAGTLALAAMLTAKTVEAYRGDPNVQGPNYSQERHEAMIQAFADNDYNTWKELMAGKGRVKDVVNETNFSRFAEAHRLALAGKTDEAKQIRAELGLGMGNGRNGR